MSPLAAVTYALGGLFTLAIIAVVFSKQSNTAGVFQSGGSALSELIKAAVSPVTMSGATGNLTSNSFGNSLVLPQVPNFTQQFSAG